MEPSRSRGLVVPPQLSRPEPIGEITKDTPGNDDILARTPPPQDKNKHSEVKTRTTTNFTTNTTTATTITSQSTRVEGSAMINARPSAMNITLEFYLQYISYERLIRMPSRGSAWDRILHAAQFFGLQVSEFGDRNVVSINRATDLVSAALAASYTLLEIGHKQAQALLPTFTALYEFAVLLTDITRIQNLENSSEAIRHDATQTFHELIVLLNNIAALYRQKISDLKPGSSAHINFGSHFGAKIEQIWRSKEALSDDIRKQKLEEAGLSITAKQLRWKLQFPDNYSVINRMYDKVDEYSDSAAETCYWLKHVLSDFFDGKDQLLCVTGGDSSGKTFLAGWVEERLARPLKVKSNHVLRYDFSHDPPNRATPTAFLKHLLSKLLDQNVSNVEVYKSIVRAFEQSFAGADSEPTEPLLWQALHDCLDAVHTKQASIVVILDACDGIVGGDADFYTKLQDCVSGLSHVRVVIFCCSVPNEVRNYEHPIDTSKVHKDIKVYFNGILSRSLHFNNLNPRECEEIVENMAAKANGNWLWTFYAAWLLSRAQSNVSILNASRDMGSEPSDVLLKVVEVLELEKNYALKTLLSIMLVVTRPLAVTELAQLLSINLRRGSMSATLFDVAALISGFCCGLVVVKGGHVHFRTKAIRAFLKGQLGNMSLPTEQEAHRQLTLRMLWYAKLTLNEDGEPSVNVLDYGLVLSIFSTTSLLGYVVQNWIEHFQASGFTASEVSDAFPNSIMLALLERTCWTRVHTKEQLVLNHKLALQVRQACFGEQHIVVLHSLVTLGYVYLNVFGSKSDAAWYFYKAAKLGEVILSETSTIVHSCMSLFLNYATAFEITDRVEIVTRHNEEKIDIVTWYEGMIRLAIKIDQHKHGYSSDEVISWYEKLAKLYLDIKEQGRVMDVYQELQAIIVARYGNKSDQAKRIHTYFATLDIVLKGSSVDKIGELEELIFEVSEEIEFTDYLCIRNWIQLTQSYEYSGYFSHAERLYVSLLQRITVICDLAANVDIHLIKIDIALEYAKFLRRQGRTQDSCSILICLWAEYKEYKEDTFNFDSDKSDSIVKVIKRIRDVAEECRASGLASVAVSILTKVWDSFNIKGHNEETQKTVILIIEIVAEITETTVTENTKTITTITETTETVVKEFFQRLVDQHQKSKVDASLFSASKALIGLYNQQQNWREAEAALKKTLELTWNEILMTGSEIKLCEHSIEESLDLARLLADCYSNQGLFVMAERIHLQIFYACFALKQDDNLRTEYNPLTGAKLLEEAINGLVVFYEKHHRHIDVINIYIKVLEKYQIELGEKHGLTIKTLYLLADHYKRLGYEEAYEYYEKIVDILNADIDFCHHEAFKAALALCIHYDARNLWSRLQLICNILWETIIRHSGEWLIEGKPKIEGETIASIYDKYSHVLNFHAKADFSVLYQIAVEYRDIISKAYNNESQLIVNALVALAKTCETQSEYYEESVQTYEKVLEKMTTIETTTAITTDVQIVKKRLSKMYVAIINDSQSITIPLDRAIEIALETYHHHKSEFKNDPEQTLLQLKDVILLYQQVNTAVSQQCIFELLEASVRYIVTVAALNMALFHAATTLATLFVRTGFTQKGRDLLQEMRRSIIYKGKFPQEDTQSVLDSQMRKVIFVFLIAFEHGLEQHRENFSYSKIMAEIVLESMLFEEYSLVENGDAKLEVVLLHGARLRCFWDFHQRTGFIETLDTILMGRFKTTYNQYFEANSSNEAKESFFYYLMAELGKDRPTIRFNFETFILQVGNNLVKILLDEGDFYKANQIGRFIFQFSKVKSLYHDPGCIRFGYKLAQYLIGIGASHPNNDDNRRAMLETSRDIMNEVIGAFDALKIAFETLRSEDLVGLIVLLHRQGNNKQLERVLTPLWRTRGDVQTTFGCKPQTIIDIGTCLVHAQCAQDRWDEAIITAKQLYYNLQRGRGRLDQETLAVSRLLASIYASIASGGKLDYASYAMDIHEAVLLEIASPSDIVYNGYTRHNPQLLAEQAWVHIGLLKELQLHLKSPQRKDWIKREKVLRDLYESLNGDFMLDTRIGESHKLPSWQYAAPTTWKFEEPEMGKTTRLIESGSNINALETAQREWVLPSRIFC
ncbi:hypothetical protein V8C37DRAFT_414229 [Trichoderma ceciliae]